MIQRIKSAKAGSAAQQPRLDQQGVRENAALLRADELACIFKMCANANRLSILLFLDSCERNVSEMAAVLGIRQPTLSQQLGELRDAGMVIGRRMAKSAIYALTADRGRRAVDMIHAATGATGSIAPTARALADRCNGNFGAQSAAMFAAVFKR